MNFTEKGWLRRYLQLRNHYTLQMEYNRLMSLPDSEALPETILYGLLQPTGLLYGHPTNVPIVYRSLLRSLRTENLTPRETLKVILTESLLNSGLFSPRYAKINQRVDVADALLESATSIGKFYQSIYPGLPVEKTGKLIKKEPKGMELSEYMINLRIGTEISEQKFWTVFIKNSLLFIDILYFGQWLHARHHANESERLLSGHQRLRLLIFKVIMAAAYANRKIESEERQMLQNYLELAHFDEKILAKAQKLLAKGAGAQTLTFERVKSPVLRRHLMELAILTVCADREINEEELAFLEKLRHKLGIDETLYLSSLLAVEGFVIEHAQRLPFFSESEKKSTLVAHFQELMRLVLQDHKTELYNIIEKNPALHRLLKKSLREKMSTDNRKKIRHDLTEAIRQMEILRLISLPRSYLTYPMLMEMLPTDLFVEQA
ncbi:MAG: TerB family tellurite resistance protein [Cyclobacteriaceae bacterium]